MTWLNHPDPRFCVCGHHADGHSVGRCFGAECPCLGFLLDDPEDHPSLTDSERNPGINRGS